MTEPVPGFDALPWPRRARARALAWLQPRISSERGTLERARGGLPSAVVRQARSWVAPLRLSPPLPRAEIPLECRFPRVEDTTPLPRSVSVLIPVHGSTELVLRCLSSVLAHSPEEAEVVVVDDASPGDTAREVRRFVRGEGRVAVHENPRNLGFPATTNRAHRLSHGELLVILNSDTVVTPGWLRRLAEVHASVPKAGLVGPLSNDTGDCATLGVRYDGAAGLLAVSDALPAGGAREVEKLSLFCGMISRRVFEEIGGLDEGYGRGFFDDDDLCEALRARGYSVLLSESTFVHHSAGGSFRRLPPLEYFGQFEVSRMRFERKWQRRWRPPVTP